jgi:hypothetical protein
MKHIFIVLGKSVLKKVNYISPPIKMITNLKYNFWLNNLKKLFFHSKLYHSLTMEGHLQLVGVRLTEVGLEKQDLVWQVEKV